MALLKALQSKVTGISQDQLFVKDTQSAMRATPMQTVVKTLPVAEPDPTLAQQRQDLITERAQIKSRGVYNEETMAKNRARLQQIENELSTLTPKTTSGRLKSGVQSILSTAAASLPVIGDTISQLNQNTEARGESDALDQLTQVNQKIRALEGGRTGVALDYIRATDAWKELDQQRQALNEQLQGIMSTPVSLDSTGMQMMRQANQYREQALEGMEGVPRFLGETALSIGQNAALLPTAAINPALPLVAMGTISAADKMYELNERGLSPSEALTRGAISGVIEAATEKIPLNSLLGVMRTGGTTALRNILRQAGIEAGEESVSYIANYIADKAAQDPEAEFSLLELARAAAGGALSGGVFGTFGSAYNTLAQRSATTDTIRANQAEPGFDARSVQSAMDAANRDFADRYGAYPKTLPTTASELTQGPALLPTAENVGQSTPRQNVRFGNGQNNTASTGEAETGLVPLTEQAVARLSSGKNNIIARKASDIVSFVRNALKKKGGPERLYLGTIPDTAAQLIRDSTGIDVTGYTAILPGDSVQHIFKNHGNAETENQRGQRAVTEDDIALIPQVLSSPDRISLSQDTDALGRTVLLLEKRIGDNYVTAQAVTDGRHALTTNSLWIQKEKGRPTTPDAGYQTSPEGNAQSALSQGPSTFPSIAQNASGSNTQSAQATPLPTTGEGGRTLPIAREGPMGLPVAGDGETTSVGAAPEGFDPWSNFQNQRSEFFPEGANAVRPVDVPTTDPEGRNIRKTASTAMGAKAIPDAVVEDIQNMVMAGELSYNVNTDRGSINRAVQRIESDGFPRALGDFSNAVQSGVVSKDMATLGQQLLVNAANAGDGKATAELLSLYAQMETAAGQAVQAASILRKLEPTYQLYAAQKAVDSLNKTISARKKGGNRNSADNIPVELWMQRVGENLADRLTSRINAPKEQVQTVAQTILSDLQKFANETAPKGKNTGRRRTDMDRIMDLFQNRTAYEEAWQAAKDTLSDNFENDPEALSAFDEWLDSSLDDTRMLTKELTGQTDIMISRDLVDKFLRQTDQAGRDAVLDEIYQNIADQVPSTWKDKWNAWRYLSMLGNPRTHIRNVMGNVGFAPIRFTKDRVAAIIEAGVNAASGGQLQRTKSFAYHPALYAAAWADYNNVADVLSGSKYDDIQSIINDKRTIFKAKSLEAARRGNSAALSAEDAVFKRVSYADALAGYLSANGVTAEQLRAGDVDQTLLSAARDYAGQEALKATFNDRNAVSDAVVRAARGLGTFGEAVLPFKRTPANILVRGAEYSPLGLAKGLTYDLAQVRSGNMTGTQVIDDIAKGLTGSALMALGAALAAGGVVTGGAGDDEKQADLNDLTGGQTYALNLPSGVSVTLDWLAPEALPFFMGVQLMNSMGENGLTADSITESLSSISEPMLEMSMLQSLNDLIDNVSYAASNEKLSGLVWSALISYLTQAIPSIGGQAERTGEEVRMSTYTDKNLPIPTDAQYALGKASARIPGWDYQQVPYIDAWGREEVTGPMPLRAFNNFLNPAYTSQENVTAVDAEVQRLYDQTGDGAVVPARPERYITVDGKRMDLTGEEYVQYATERGKMAYDLADELIQSGVYQGFSDEEKARALDTVYTYADAMAKADLPVGYQPEDWVGEAEQAETDLGLSEVEYLAYRSKYGATMSQDKLREAYQSGLSVDAWMTYAEADRDRNGDGSVNQAEIIAAIESSGLSAADKDRLYEMELSDAGRARWEKAQQWGMGIDDYLTYYPIYAATGKGLTKEVKLQQLQNAGMTKNEALRFWELMKG